jgi:cytochrome c biogenesis protein CcmG/thiol:disulfide interchange protein DsbE
MHILRLFRLKLWVVVLFAGGLWAQASPQDLLHKPAPVFVRDDLSGRKIKLKTYHGKVVLLNFWATWCAPCQVELPKFETWQNELGAQGLQIVAVSMDDDAALVHSTVRRLHLDFPVVMGDARLGDEYGGVLGLPVTYLIDRDGRIVAKFEGETDLDAMERQIQLVLHKR